MSRHRRRLLILPTVGVLLASLLLVAGPAEALIYWTEYEENRIGRANLNGKRKFSHFIEVTAPIDVVVTDTHIYWISAGGGDQIGRAKLDGTGVKEDFITGAAVNNPWSLTASGKRLYWANAGTSTIVSAKLDGTDVDIDLVTVIQPRGVAVNGTHLYWTRAGGGSGDGWVARATLAGGSADHDYIDAENNAFKVAVDDYYVYWLGGGTIGRSTVGSAGEDPDFIEGQSGSQDLAVLGGYLYWTKNSGVVGRAKIDGTGVKGSFMTGLTFPTGLHVDAIEHTGSKFRIGKVKVDRKKGTATVRVRLPGPGRLTLAGKGLKKVVKKKAKTGFVTLKLTAKGATKQKLRATGSVAVKAKVTFRPMLSHGSRTKPKNVTLVYGG